MIDADRELLELAAKAVGIEHVTPSMVEWGLWNPLTDDGDALRLAVKLGLAVSVCTGYTAILDDQSRVNHDDDPYSATRRAIVRAAAEIGRNMK